MQLQGYKPPAEALKRTGKIQFFHCMATRAWKIFRFENFRNASWLPGELEALTRVGRMLDLNDQLKQPPSRSAVFLCRKRSFTILTKRTSILHVKRLLSTLAFRRWPNRLTALSHCYHIHKTVCGHLSCLALHGGHVWHKHLQSGCSHP